MHPTHCMACAHLGQPCTIHADPTPWNPPVHLPRPVHPQHHNLYQPRPRPRDSPSLRNGPPPNRGPNFRRTPGANRPTRQPQTEASHRASGPPDPPRRPFCWDYSWGYTTAAGSNPLPSPYADSSHTPLYSPSPTRSAASLAPQRLEGAAWQDEEVARLREEDARWEREMVWDDAEAECRSEALEGDARRSAGTARERKRRRLNIDMGNRELRGLGLYEYEGCDASCYKCVGMDGGCGITEGGREGASGASPGLGALGIREG